jgi:hypothetical protein
VHIIGSCTKKKKKKKRGHIILKKISGWGLQKKKKMRHNIPVTSVFTIMPFSNQKKFSKLRKKKNNPKQTELWK